MLRLDRLLLPALTSVTALGIYASVGTMTELIAWPLLAWSDSRLGVWRAAHDQRVLSLHRCLVYASIYALGAGAIGIIVLRVLLVPLLSPEYAPAEQLITPLVLAAAVLGVSQLLITALIAIRRNIEGYSDGNELWPCREHWSIENKLHWIRDVTFTEDHSQIRTGNGPAVMATLRNSALSRHRLNGHTNIAAAC